MSYNFTTFTKRSNSIELNVIKERFSQVLLFLNFNTLHLISQFPLSISALAYCLTAIKMG